MGPFGVIVFLAVSVRPCWAASSPCLGSGELAGVIFGCIFGTLLLSAAIAFGLWYLKSRKERSEDTDLKGQAEVPPTDRRLEHFAYDNPYFKEDETKLNGTDVAKGKNRNDSGAAQNGQVRSFLRVKKKLGSVLSARGGRPRGSFSAESLASMEEVISVPLKSQDFTGLGFNIFGNMRDGIFVKDVLGRGPARESGRIHEGDKILSLTVSFENMVYEDALTILSYASPYSVVLEVGKGDATKGPAASASNRHSQAYSSERRPQLHPLYKSQSSDELTGGGSGGAGAPTKPRDARRVKSVQLSSESSPAKEGPRLVLGLESIAEKDAGAPSPRSALKPATGIPPQRPLQGAAQAQTPVGPSPRETLQKTVTVVAEVESPKPVAAAASVMAAGEDAGGRPTTSPSAPIRKKPKRPSEGSSTSSESVGPRPTPVRDPYAELSYEDRLQVIRLSYEDADVSRSTPNLSCPTSDGEERQPGRPEHRPGPLPGDKDPKAPAKAPKGLLDPGKAPGPHPRGHEGLTRTDGERRSRGAEAPGVSETSPAVPDRNLQAGEGLRTESPPLAPRTPPPTSGTAAKIPPEFRHEAVAKIRPPPGAGMDFEPWEFRTGSGSGPRSGPGPSDRETASEGPEKTVHLDSPRQILPGRPDPALGPPESRDQARDRALTSPPLVASKRDSGYETHPATSPGSGASASEPAPPEPSSGPPDSPVEFDQDQYERLLYFQRQLAKQHEELARLGIKIPLEPGLPSDDSKDDHFQSSA